MEPSRHWNFIERAFGETRRQVKVVGRQPGEHSVPQAGLRGARPRLGRMVQIHDDPRRARLLHELRRTLHDPADPTAPN